MSKAKRIVIGYRGQRRNALRKSKPNSRLREWRYAPMKLVNGAAYRDAR